MAAKYLRKQTWWLRFYHPRSNELVRESLGTSDEARAELLRKRVELEAALLDPRFQAVPVPDNVRTALGFGTAAANVAASQNAGEVDAIQSAASAPPGVPGPPDAARPRVALDEALRGYFEFIRTENAPHHVENKISILRRFLGGIRAEQFVKSDDEAARARRLASPCEAFFTGTFLDEISPALLQGFFSRLDLAIKTKRHYREFFHHFFGHCLKFGLCRPENFYCPNPASALPAYLSRNQRIVYLNQEQVDEELRSLESYPAIRMAVAIMIHAGLRRAEMLWLTRDAIAPDLSFLSVVNRIDHDTDVV